MPAKTKGRIDFDLDGVGHILEDRLLKVPIYQRSYAWEAEQVDDFWDDLRGALDGTQTEYFLGTVVLTDGPDRLMIIDGQQRLATTSLLLAGIRDVFVAVGDDKRAGIVQGTYLAAPSLKTAEDVPRLVLNQEDDDFFRKSIVEQTAVAASKESHHRIAHAFKRLSEALRDDVMAYGVKAPERLGRWVDFVATEAVVITVEVPTEADAFLIFETLNDRGLDLTIADLLKNYLFGRSGERLETVKANWIASLAQLDISAENAVFVGFLRHYWSSKHGAVRERDLYAGIKDRVVTETQAVDFSVELELSARDYAALRSSSHDRWVGLGSTAKGNIETLLRLELEQYRPLLLAVMQHFGDAELKETLRALVSWSVRGLIVGGIGGGSTEKAYCDAAVKVRSGAIKDPTALRTELTSTIPDDKTFREAFERARVTRARIARYLLIALQKKKSGEAEPELVPNDNEDEVNLEHVLPKGPTVADWPSFTTEEASNWLHRLGNLALLAKGPNGRIGNKPFAQKRPILAASALISTSEIATRADWTEAEISARQVELAALAVTTWPRG